jgi:hypothetical protein
VLTSRSYTSGIPSIENIARIQASSDEKFVAPPDGSWGIVILKKEGGTQLFLTGITTRPLVLDIRQGDEITSIAFKPGWFMPHAGLAADQADAFGAAAKNIFWLNASTALEVPTFENAEVFVQKLQKEGWITQNEVVTSALAGTPKAMTPRTLQRHFIKTTGVTYNYLQQIYRANEAAALIKGGKSLPEVALEAGYADQSHMTRWLKHIIGSSPGDIARQDKKPGV